MKSKKFETQKLSFVSIKDVLSRDEMKEIMAGSGCGSCSGKYGSVSCASGPVTGTCICGQNNNSCS